MCSEIDFMVAPSKILYNFVVTKYDCKFNRKLYEHSTTTVILIVVDPCELTASQE